MPRPATAEVLKLLQNRGRYHQVEELTPYLNCSETEVEETLKHLKAEGKVEEGSWGAGHKVWGATAEGMVAPK